MFANYHHAFWKKKRYQRKNKKNNKTSNIDKVIVLMFVLLVGKKTEEYSDIKAFYYKKGYIIVCKLFKLFKSFWWINLQLKKFLRKTFLKWLLKKLLKWLRKTWCIWKKSSIGFSILIHSWMWLFRKNLFYKYRKWISFATLINSFCLISWNVRCAGSEMVHNSELENRQVRILGDFIYSHIYSNILRENITP